MRRLAAVAGGQGGRVGRGVGEAEARGGAGWGGVGGALEQGKGGGRAAKPAETPPGASPLSAAAAEEDCTHGRVVSPWVVGGPHRGSVRKPAREVWQVAPRRSLLAAATPRRLWPTSDIQLGACQSLPPSSMAAHTHRHRHTLLACRPVHRGRSPPCAPAPPGVPWRIRRPPAGGCRPAPPGSSSRSSRRRLPAPPPPWRSSVGVGGGAMCGSWRVPNVWTLERPGGRGLQRAPAHGPVCTTASALSVSCPSLGTPCLAPPAPPTAPHALHWRVEEAHNRALTATGPRPATPLHCLARPPASPGPRCLRPAP